MFLRKSTQASTRLDRSSKSREIKRCHSEIAGVEFWRLSNAKAPRPCSDETHICARSPRRDSKRLFLCARYSRRSSERQGDPGTAYICSIVVHITRPCRRASLAILFWQSFRQQGRTGARKVVPASTGQTVSRYTPCHAFVRKLIVGVTGGTAAGNRSELPFCRMLR